MKYRIRSFWLAGLAGLMALAQGLSSDATTFNWVQILIAIASLGTLIGLFQMWRHVPTLSQSSLDSSKFDFEAERKSLLQQVSERSSEVRALERKFQMTFDRAAIGIALVGLDGRWLHVNPRLCEITGYSREELDQKTFAEITHPEDVDRDWSQARALAKGEISSYEMEKRYIRKDGSVLWIKLSVALCRTSTGVPEFYISCVDDISSEKETRLQSEMEKQKIINLFEQVATPIAIYDGPEHRIALANPEYRRQTGRPDLVGLTYEEAFPFAKEQGLVHLLDHVYNEGQPWTASEFPLRVDFPDGTSSERFINATLQPYRSVKGDVLGLINLSYDVTEQVQARQKLQESQQRLQIALKASNMGVWEWDLKTDFVQWDPHMVELFGGPGATFSGQVADYTARLHPDDRTRAWETIQSALESGKDFELEHRVIWDDGSVHWVLGRGGAVRDEHGKPMKVLGVALDIDSRKKFVEALKSSEERFRTVFEQSPLSIEIHSPDGALQQVNDSWLRLWNIPKENVSAILKSYNVLQDPQLEALGVSEYIKAGFKGKFSKTPPTLYNPNSSGVDGRPRWIETYISPILNHDGTLREVVIIHEDITERKKAEEVLVSAKETAEAANQAKTQFLANMSHEIRTPLGAMLGFAQLMLEDESATEFQKNSLRTISRNGEQLHRIINEVLDISKVEANKLEIEKSKFDLEETIRDVTSLLSIKAEQKGIEFNVSSEGPLPDSVETDSMRFKQILINVIGNAIKFTEKGRVDVTFKLRDHEAKDGSSCLEIKVQDTGIGISQEKLSHLFQPFSQGDQATTRKFGGTGLGLYLSKKLAQNLGGDLRLVESKENTGSTFLILIDIGHMEKRPLLSFRSAAGEHVVKGNFKQVQTPRLPNIRVLVVDDSPDNLQLTKMFLNSTGAEVETCLSAFEAIEILKHRQFDVILMDIQMPGMDGYEAVQKLRLQGYEKPIVALTAHAMKGEQERCLEAGFDGYLNKPINKPALVREIKMQSERGNGLVS